MDTACAYSVCAVAKQGESDKELNYTVNSCVRPSSIQLAQRNIATRQATFSLSWRSLTTDASGDWPAAKLNDARRRGTSIQDELPG